MFSIRLKTSSGDIFLLTFSLSDLVINETPYIRG